ncbi:hypothetical protein EYD45_07515 [Hyunsoonleella flava]|uniref:Type II secretion system protein n=1 Tax=Hyunsoonleella flava TaxID=2527939 RepID=A0A4Q9FJT1_9FLAO|nr:hypothetical protein [Hyunsoonleella flava]TBN04456.1 hypothetical protein EYD45_07515 [Hyunsoonleella flava]
MVVLKKVKASTLMETLVASILIVVIFMMASMIFNNLFSYSIKTSTRVIDTHLNEMEYLFINEEVTTPLYDDFEAWTITAERQILNKEDVIVIEATHQDRKQNISRTIVTN